MRTSLFLIIFLTFPNAFAGVIELGVSGNYRQSYYGYDSATDKKSYNIYTTVTGSFSYYFAEQSAVELSYTDGTNDENRPQYKTRTFIQVYGLDFMYTLVEGKEAPFKPYVKIGAAYQIKRSQYKQVNQDPINLGQIRGWSPSAGVGLRLLFGSFVIRTGLEVISSPLDTGDDGPLSFDIAARAGLSWMF